LLRCSLDKPAYLNSETIQLKVEIESCGLKVRYVSALLRKVVVLQSSVGRVRIFRKDLHLEEAEHYETMEIPLGNDDDPLQPSTKGTLIQCSYNITVTAHLGTLFCSHEPPSVSLPVAVLTSGAPGWAATPLLKDWHPQVHAVPIRNIVVETGGVQPKRLLR
jgi:hypothetical protein